MAVDLLKYDTTLTPGEEAAYSDWVKAQSKATGRDMSQDTFDYDMRGFFKANGPVDLKAGAHFTDEYKKPNHPTFSSESRYHGVDNNTGGVWGKDTEGRDTFTPGATNLQNMSAEELQDYFKRVEPNGRLILDAPRDLLADMPAAAPAQQLSGTMGEGAGQPAPTRTITDLIAGRPATPAPQTGPPGTYADLIAGRTTQQTGTQGTMGEGVVPTEGMATVAPLALGAAAGTGIVANAVVGGALGALEPADTGLDRLKHAALGAGVAGAISGAAKLAGWILSPKNPAEVAALKAIGVELTPGQEVGPAAAKLEQALESVPVVGQQVSNARELARDTFVRASVQTPLTVIGQKLDPATEAGWPAIKEMAQKTTTFYDNLLPKLSVRLDSQIAQDVGTARTTLDTASTEVQGKFQTIVRNELVRRFAVGPGGVMSGVEMKAAEETLTKEIKAYSRGSPDERKLADALDDVRLGLRNLVMRSNPADAPDLARANLAWAMSKRIEDAAAKAKVDGKFTPNDLLTASVRKSRVATSTAAKGEALMQDLGAAGEKVMGSKLPDSGTAFRRAINTGSFFGQLTSPLTGAVALGYTRPGRAVLRGTARNIGQAGRAGALTGAAAAGNPFINSLVGGQ